MPSTIPLDIHNTSGSVSKDPSAEKEAATEELVPLLLERELELGHLPHAKKVHWSYYLGLAIAIPVWAITPASWVFLAVQLWRHGFALSTENMAWFKKAVLAWAGCEVGLPLYFRSVLRES